MNVMKWRGRRRVKAAARNAGKNGTNPQPRSNPSHRVERRRAQFRLIGFRCIGPFGLRGKEPPNRADVSFSPSKIPYGGFSPVRLQTGFLRHDLPLPDTAAGLYVANRPPPYPCGPCGQVFGAIRQSVPVQRPFALRPVILSGQIRRYYGLICASPRFPPIYALDGGPCPPIFRGPGEGPQFNLLICSLRAAFRTPTV